MIIKQK